MIPVTIDGQSIKVEEGTTILEGAQRLGIHIPTLCHHPALEPYGACRLCTVEITPKGQTAGRSRLVTACNYPIRWEIEVYHKILKSGCHVEQSQLATADRLRPLIALYSIIAWRLFWLTHMARHDPDAPCTVVLTDHEWRALYAYHHKANRTPDVLPTVAQVTLWIAQLGGFLARKNDGHPGVTVIWRGWTRLHDISSAWLIFHPH